MTGGNLPAECDIRVTEAGYYGDSLHSTPGGAHARHGAVKHGEQPSVIADPARQSKPSSADLTHRAAGVGPVSTPLNDVHRGARDRAEHRNEGAGSPTNAINNEVRPIGQLAYDSALIPMAGEHHATCRSVMTHSGNFFER